MTARTGQEMRQSKMSRSVNIFAGATDDLLDPSIIVDPPNLVSVIGTGIYRHGRYMHRNTRATH